MKHVFETSEVAHIWANQTQDSGRNAGNNFYFNGATIYSYGSHFPIATIAGNDVFFTMRSYSNTTAKHISTARQAISHKNIIWVYDVPTNLEYATTSHESNLKAWHKVIKYVFDELGNPRLRDTQSRINAIANHIAKLNIYCQYFKLKIKDKEFKALLKLAESDNFIATAKQAKAKATESAAKKMNAAVKAYELYIALWRNYDSEGIKAMSDKNKELCNYYQNNAASFTRLRYNTGENRLETSKGVKIPAEIAKRAFIQLNGCMEGTCKDISVPIMEYTITETTKDYIKAGCHTIPKTDIKYIADLLKW